jgi:hypothetical protein
LSSHEQVLALTHVVQNGIAVYGLKHLATGRVVVLNSAMHRNAVAVILRAEPSSSISGQQGQGQGGAATTKRFSVLVLVDAAAAGARDGSNGAQRQASGRTGGSAADVPLPVTELSLPSGGAAGVIAVVSVADMLVVTKHKLKVSVLETLERPVPAAQADLAQQMLRLCERSSSEGSGGGLEALDPLRDMRITSMEVADAWMQLESARARLAMFSCTRCPTFRECYLRHHRYGTIFIFLYRPIAAISMTTDRSLIPTSNSLVEQYRRRRELSTLKDSLQFRLSDESLQVRCLQRAKLSVNECHHHSSLHSH